jgi:D-alanyl-D-alanine carboxypeptidase (penicillin-binding protein 5/6)
MNFTHRVNGMVKKSILGLLLLVLCQSLWSVAADNAVLIPSPPKLAAHSYVLMDAYSGKILVAKNENERLPPASLTKMMTSYILSTELTKGDVSNDDMVPISKNAWAQNPVFDGSSLMFIEVGKQVSLGDLHKGIIISSGNDATVAVAEYLAGSEDAFADIMNQRAELLGMRDSHFANSHGLPASQHYSSALDMALLARAIITDYPEDYKLYSERSYTFNGIPQANRNKLLWRDPTVDGLKTGYTSKAGYGLVASALRKDMRLIAVVMGAKSVEARAQENQKLLQFGFRYYETLKLYSAGEKLNEVRIWGGEQDTLSMGIAEDIFVTIPQGKRNALKAELEFDEVIRAPIDTGEIVGVLHLSMDDKPIWLKEPRQQDGDADSVGGEVLAPKLVALDAVAEAGMIARLWDSLMLFIYQLIGLSTS